MGGLRSAHSASARSRALIVGALGVLGALGLILPLLLAPGGTALAGSSPPPPRHGHPVLLPGSIPPALRTAKRLRHEDAARQLRVTVALGLSDPDGLAALIASQQDPHSPQYHRYLTPQAFVDRFAPSAQGVTAVRQFLSAWGLRVTSVSANRTLVGATGTVAQLESAFGTTIGRYQLDKREVYGPDRPPQIPDTLASVVLGIFGLDDVAQPRPILPARAGTVRRSPGSAPRSGQAAPIPQGPVPGAYSPLQLQSAYDLTPIAGGAGQRVAVYELAPYIPGDITAYRTQYSLPNPALSTSGAGAVVDHPVDGASPTCDVGGDPACDFGGGIAQADLDLEVLSAVAPSATLDVYTGHNDATFDDAYGQIVSDDKDAVVTTSWGQCEPLVGQTELQSLDATFAQAAAQGQTIFAAAGDFGSDDCGSGPSSQPSVDSPASDPNVLGVGGTLLTLNGDGTYASETTWNDAFGGGGGGLSAYFSRPSWQAGVGVTNPYSTGAREVPDLAADADWTPGYSAYCSSTAECGGSSTPWMAVGGTRAATSLWAGTLTDINAFLIAQSAAPTRWANWTLYQLFANQQPYAPYHDVTIGTNDVDYGAGSPYQGDYPATVCYDLATGIGSPDAWNIARDLQGGIQSGGGGTCPVAGITNLIQDGSFEQPPGTSPWMQFSLGGQPVIAHSLRAHSGAAAALPCGYAECDDRVWQRVAVPATVNHATLAFWLESFSSLALTPPTPPCLDHLYVTVAAPDGTVVSGGAVKTWCETEADAGYKFEVIDVTSLLQAHLNQPVVLTFRGTTANVAGRPLLYTSWAIDDVSLIVS
jgi:kumamolisin